MLHLRASPSCAQKHQQLHQFTLMEEPEEAGCRPGSFNSQQVHSGLVSVIITNRNEAAGIPQASLFTHAFRLTVQVLKTGNMCTIIQMLSASYL